MHSLNLRRHFQVQLHDSTRRGPEPRRPDCGALRRNDRRRRELGGLLLVLAGVNSHYPTLVVGGWDDPRLHARGVGDLSFAGGCVARGWYCVLIGQHRLGIWRSRRM